MYWKEKNPHKQKEAVFSISFMYGIVITGKIKTPLSSAKAKLVILQLSIVFGGYGPFVWLFYGVCWSQTTQPI